jgi:transglutaminase-like putative cysteine protease
MIYTIRHVTRYRYPQPVRESVMEVRKHPITNEHQRCINFHLAVSPEVRIFQYHDYLGNLVHHFDLPFRHQEISVTAEAVVEVKPSESKVAVLEHPGSWEELDSLTGLADYYDMLMPSRFIETTPLLEKLAVELGAVRRLTPAQLTLELTKAMHKTFAYDRSITKVDSPIDLALEARRGVCQDYAHILIGLLRHVGIPARYVSGYLFQEEQPIEEGPENRGSHAWIEAMLPQLGWTGFDPSLGQESDHRHIAASIGRDYSDVPPTRGVYRGEAEGELTYAVQVHPPEEPIEEDRFRLLQS